MITNFRKFILPIFLAGLWAVAPDVVEAQDVCNKKPDHPKCSGNDDGGGDDPGNHVPSDDYSGPDMADPNYVNTDNPALPPVGHPTYAWMHPDVGVAFGFGYDGIGSHMITVDSFSGTLYSGNLDGNPQSLTHGAWTYKQSYLVAPGASRNWLDHDTHAGSDIIASYAANGGVNTVSLSFGLLDPAGTDVTANGYSLGTNLWDSLVDEAWGGTAVFVKAAGNTNGGAVDGTFRVRLGFRPTNVQDSLNLLLIGAPGALFVGALDGNGTTSNPATIASYSTIAGGNTDVQDMFLVAGVHDEMTGLAGTSFAAPIVTSYAAILGQKFNAQPVQIVDQLLNTARTDTIADFGANGDCTLWSSDICARSSVYGVGEADLSRALAPAAIPF